MGIHDEKITAIYLRGGARKEAMKECCLNTNQVATVSNRLGLRWSWPLENRESGLEPAQTKAPARPRKTSPQRTTPFLSKPKVYPQTSPDQGDALGQLLKPSGPAEKVSETIAPKRPPLRPSPGFTSARERRERGIDESRFEPFRQGEKEDEFEKFIRINLYG